MMEDFSTVQVENQTNIELAAFTESDGPGPGRKRSRKNASVASDGAKIPVDPIYGEDAAQRFVADHFKNSNQKADSQPKELAIFVNLAANRGLLNSSLREDEEIRKLTELTSGKPVTVIVQTAMNRDKSLNHLRATKEDLIIGALGGVDPDVKQTEVVRYEIADGSKRLLSAGYSRGMTEDLGDLLKSSPRAMQADRLVYLGRAHGMAMHGLRGDAGNTSIGDFKSTMSRALMDAGRKTFDVVDFDSCLMGNAQALTELAPVAKYIIASEEPEVAIAHAEQVENVENNEKPGSNAQPLALAVRTLIEDAKVGTPNIGARETAALIFSMNEKECKEVSKDGLCGANTLGLYDMSAVPSFSQSLDSFGKALLNIRANASNEIPLQKAAGATPEIDGEPDGLGSTVKRRDLGIYIKQVQSGIADGSIADTKNGELTTAAFNLQNAMKALTVEHFNSYKPALKARFEEVHLPPAALDGVSVFLPQRMPAEFKPNFEKQLNQESISSQPNWNQFVKETGSPR